MKIFTCRPQVGARPSVLPPSSTNPGETSGTGRSTRPADLASVELRAGSGTPLHYYLQDTLHAKDAQWGQSNAIFSASFIPTFLVFGVLYRKFPLKTLRFWGTVVAIPQMVPLFIHPVTDALITAAPIGLMGGVATAAYPDLMIRSCPRGLQGTLLMMSAGLYAIVQGPGNAVGTNLCDYFGGFTVCVIAITIVYASILPFLQLVPKRLIDTADRQTPDVAFTAD